MRSLLSQWGLTAVMSPVAGERAQHSIQPCRVPQERSLGSGGSTVRSLRGLPIHHRFAGAVYRGRRAVAGAENRPVPPSIPGTALRKHSVVRRVTGRRGANVPGLWQSVPGVSQPRCRWCAAAAVNSDMSAPPWRPCGVVRVGAAGTVQELRGLFRNIPWWPAHQPRGPLPISPMPMLVVATPKGTLRVDDGGVGAYRAVAILDAWTSQYSRH